MKVRIIRRLSLKPGTLHYATRRSTMSKKTKRHDDPGGVAAISDTIRKLGEERAKKLAARVPHIIYVLIMRPRNRKRYLDQVWPYPSIVEAKQQARDLICDYYQEKGEINPKIRWSRNEKGTIDGTYSTDRVATKEVWDFRISPHEIEISWPV